MLLAEVLPAHLDLSSLCILSACAHLWTPGSYDIQKSWCNGASFRKLTEGH